MGTGLNAREVLQNRTRFRVGGQGFYIEHKPACIVLDLPIELFVDGPVYDSTRSSREYRIFFNRVLRRNGNRKPGDRICVF